MTTLFDPLIIGKTAYKNRIFMAPLTRNRAAAGDVVHELHATYYAQRASAGLIISEATQISQQGKGYIATPGIYSDAQVEGWRKVTAAVHERNGKIFAQLWHVGRISHTSLQENGQAPVAPSAIRANAQTFIGEMVDVSAPRALLLEDIEQIIEDYTHAAQCAKDAGFDGVEIHAANGYLIDQFIQSSTNSRKDAYGGNAAQRAKFLFDVVEAVSTVWEHDKIGVRLSPHGQFNDMGDENPFATFSTVIEGLNRYSLGYLHMVEQFPGKESTEAERDMLEALRNKWQGIYIANGGYDKLRGQHALQNGHADAIAYGRPYIANPDLVERFMHDAPLNEPDGNTFYGGSAEGYTDYPTMKEAQAA
jgi:N-ethylmaleimide reductase